MRKDNNKKVVADYVKISFDDATLDKLKCAINRYYLGVDSCNKPDPENPGYYLYSDEFLALDEVDQQKLMDAHYNLHAPKLVEVEVVIDLETGLLWNKQR